MTLNIKSSWITIVHAIIDFLLSFPFVLTVHICFPIAVAGFAGGFLVPEPQMPLIYYWLFYINPTHWAYSGMVNILLKDIVFDCKYASPLECESSMGKK